MAGPLALAADKVVKIGMDLSLTGADAEGAMRIRNRIMMAIERRDEGTASRVTDRNGDPDDAPRHPVSTTRAGRDERAQDGGRQGCGGALGRR